MFKKLIYMTMISMGLAACATQSAPQTATTPQYDAALLVGKWHCQAQIAENVHYHFDTHYQANGISQSKGIVTVKLDEEKPDLAWQFETHTQDKWHIDGAYYIEQQTAKPIVKLLPIENKNTRLLLKTFEKSNPLVADMKNIFMQNLSQFDDEETKAKIITLDSKNFQAELEVDGTKAISTCQRI